MSYDHLRALAFAVLSLPAATSVAHAYAFETCDSMPVTWEKPMVLTRHLCSLPDGSPKTDGYHDALATVQRYVTLAERGPDTPASTCTLTLGDEVNDVSVVQRTDIDGASGMAITFSDGGVGRVGCDPLGGTFYQEANVLVASDILFDAFDPAYLPGNSTIPGLGRFVWLHELGHAHGLSHPAEPMAVMHDAPAPAALPVPELLPDDAAGLRSLAMRWVLGAGRIVLSMQTTGAHGNYVTEPLEQKAVCPSESFSLRFSLGNTKVSTTAQGALIRVTLRDRKTGWEKIAAEWSWNIAPGLSQPKLDTSVPADTAPGDYDLYLTVIGPNTFGTQAVRYPLSFKVKDCRDINLASRGPWIQRNDAFDSASASIAVARRGDSIELLGLGGDRSVWAQWQTPQGWTGWQQVAPIKALKRIAALTLADGRLALFGIGYDDGQVWTTTEGWGRLFEAWTRLDPQQNLPVTDLAVALNNDGLPEVYAVTPEGVMYRNDRYWIVSGVMGGQTPWSGFSAVSDGSVRLRVPYVGRDADGRLFVFSVGDDSHVWLANHLRDTPVELFGSRRYALSSFSPMSGPTSGAWIEQMVVGHTSDASGRKLALLTVDDRGEVHSRAHQNAPCKPPFCILRPAWTPWEKLPFWPQIEGIAVANHAENGAGNGRMEVIGWDKWLQVFNVAQTTPSSMGAWPSQDQVKWGWLRGRGVSQIVATENADGRLEFFGVAPDHTVRHNWQTPGSWTGWHY